MNRDRGDMGRKASTAAIVLTAAFAVILLSSFAGVLGGTRGSELPNRPLRGLAKVSLPRPIPPAFKPSKLAPLSGKEPRSRWAPIRISAPARNGPRTSAPVVAHLSTRTPEGTVNIVSVLGSRDDAKGHLWVRVNLPVLPNGTTGWVARKALGGYGYVSTRLTVDLNALQMTLYGGHRAIFKAAIGVGSSSSPTPRGTFYIRDEVTDFNDPFYGPIAFGTSARSNTLTDWPAGGFIGIHGTNRPDLIPGAISHGCIRLANSDIIQLARLMPVGTPVTIR